MKVPLSMLQKLTSEEVGSDDEDDEAPSQGCSKGDCGSGCGQGTCNTGGATLSAQDSEFVSASLNLVSVKVPSMDAEHGECADALRQLAEEGSPSSLERVFACLAGHFKHEEELFDQYGFGAHRNERLSAKKTHIEDHQRILGKLQRRLASKAGAVPAEFVREVLQDFHEHTSRYDSQYADVLSEQGAR